MDLKELNNCKYTRKRLAETYGVKSPATLTAWACGRKPSKKYYKAYKDICKVVANFQIVYDSAYVYTTKELMDNIMTMPNCLERNKLKEELELIQSRKGKIS